VGNLVFTFAAIVLWYRTRRRSRENGLPTPFPKSHQFKIFVAAIIISDAAIIIRAVYRVIELARGWRGVLITTEYDFYALDTAPMILCMSIWILGHPGVMLDREVLSMNFKGEGNDEYHFSGSGELEG